MKKAGLKAVCFALMVFATIGAETAQAASGEQGQGAAEKAAVIDKKELVENLQKASRGVNRTQSIAIQDVQLQGMLRLKSRQISDTDIAQKVMHVSSEIQDYAFDLESISNAMVQSSLANAQQKGMSEEQLRNSDEMRKAQEAMKQRMTQIAEGLKGQKTEQYIIDQTLYIRVKDRWFKMEQPYFKIFWDLAARLKDNSVGSDSEKAMEGLPEEAKKVLGPMISYLANKDFAGGNFISSISEGDFQGKPCYVLDINDPKLTDMIQKVLVASVQQQAGPGVSSSVDFLSTKSFVAKDTYLTAGERVTMSASIITSRSPKAMKADTVLERIISYPTESILISKELNGATPVKDEAELRKVLIDSIQKDLKTGS